MILGTPKTLGIILCGEMSVCESVFNWDDVGAVSGDGGGSHKAGKASRTSNQDAGADMAMECRTDARPGKGANGWERCLQPIFGTVAPAIVRSKTL